MVTLTSTTESSSEAVPLITISGVQSSEAPSAGEVIVEFGGSVTAVTVSEY